MVTTIYEPIVTGNAAIVGNEDSTISISGFSISDDDAPTSLRVKLDASHGSLALTTTTGITGTTSGASLDFEGSIANLNTALNSLTYQGNANYSGTDPITIQVSDDNGVSWHGYHFNEAGKFYNPNNGHYYEYISTSDITWDAAKIAADARTLHGLKGYLTTIGSAIENNFITLEMTSDGWMGASDEPTVTGHSADQWYWVTGPESGTQFWSGLAGGASVGGQYTNWWPGEPNNFSGIESYGQFLDSSAGRWNDMANSFPSPAIAGYPHVNGYIAEYGGNGLGTDGFGTLQLMQLGITVNNINDAPVLNDLNGDAATAAAVNQVALIDTDMAVTITDVDTTNFNGGTLVITTTSGTANGSFSLDGVNAVSGGNDTLAASETITVGGTAIGTVHATNDGQNGHTLTITLNSNATLTNVSELIRNIGFESTTIGLRNFNLALSESDGQTANAAFSVDVYNQPVIKGISAASGSEHTPIGINGLTVSDASNPSSLTVKIVANHGDLTLGTTTGITGATFGSTLQFSGSIADLNTALSSLSYRGDLAYSGTDNLAIQVSNDNGVTWHDYFVDETGKFFNPNNGHYYEFVSAPGMDWITAKTAAEGRTLYGLNGYLATVTSQQEQNFITPRPDAVGWLGANDAVTEGDWRWVTGPEAGTPFWSGNASGSSVSGRYNHWAAADPDDLAGIEDYARLALNGFWDDLPGNTPGIQGYIVEYGGTGFGTLQAAPLAVTVNAVSDTPVLNNLSGDATMTASNQVVLIDSGMEVSVTGADPAHFDGGTLVITTTYGTAGSFSLDGVNAASGGDSTIAASETITVGGIAIGTVHAANDGQNGHTLTIAFNSSATRDAVSELISNIGFGSATTGLHSFNLALTEADADTTDATFSVDVQDNPVIKGRSSVSGNEDTPISISGLTVGDASNPSSLMVKIAANHGTLTLGTTTGVTGTTSGNTLQFSGSIADLNTALNSLSYLGNLNYSGTDDLAVQVSNDSGVTWHDYFINETGKFYNPNNGHYYEFVSAPGMDWTTAKTAAEARTLYGLDGYLATVTSQQEHDFITPKLGGSGWLGANDAVTEDDWRWVTGPEAGTPFWSGNASGSAVSGRYNHWASTEPDDLGGTEDYARLALNGFWNDLPGNTPGIQGYIVEYGGTGFGTLQAAPLTVTVNAVNDAPVLHNLDGDATTTTVNQAVLIDTGTAVTITDVDATDFNGGALAITTTHGTTNGSFSLDGVNATSGGNGTISAGETIVVGGTAIGTVTHDGQSGHNLIITFNGNATLVNVSELIKNIGFASASAGLRNFNLALSESSSAISNAAFSVNVQTATVSTVTLSIIDGVTISTTASSNGGMNVTTTVVPIVDNSRHEDPTTQHKTLADIPLAVDSTGMPVILASLPVGVGLTSQSINSNNSLTLREHLIAASHPKISDETVFNDILHNGIDKYVEAVADEKQVTVRTITFKAGTDQAINAPIILTGALGTGENDLNNPLRQEALVIDTRNLPADTVLQLDKVEFAIIIGGGRFVGGSGHNFVVADGADQFIVLGAGEDTLHGGDGNDTVGSKEGDDQLFGDNGNDHLIGGDGNDTLYGGDGNDLLQGDISNAGNITFALDNQGQVLSTLQPLDSALADPVSTNWHSDQGRITNDDRVAFVYRDIDQLKTISTLYQAVTHRLPTTEEMNHWSSQNLSAKQAGQIAYDHYLSVSGDVTQQTVEVQLSGLIDSVWGAGSTHSDLVNTGVEFLNNGGSWSEILLYLANHENLTTQLSDSNGNLQLTQDLAISEIGLSSGSGDDTLYGGNGDDVLAGGYGHNVIDGGDGVDTVNMVETLGTHHILLTKDGFIRIERNDGQAINDLQGVEKIVFSDQTLNMDFANLDGHALKQAAGLMHLMNKDADIWAQLNQFASSNSMIDAYSQSLMQTSSYQEHWAAQSNREFVTELGEIVLGQPLTSDDLDYWTDQLDQNLSQKNDLFVIAADNTVYQNTFFGNDGLILL